MKKIALYPTLVVSTALAFSVLAAPPGAHTDKPALVFLVAGQSNAGGCGIISPEAHEKGHKWAAKRPTVPGSTAAEVGLSTDPADYTHSYIWVPDSGFEAIDIHRNTRPDSLGNEMHGIELPVAGQLEKKFPGNDIYIVKYGPSGKNLHHDWDPSRPDGLYAEWLGYYGDAMKTLVDAYPEVRVIGLYWDQGESDKKKADEYYDNLKNFFSVFRADSGVKDLHIYVRKHLYDFANVDKIVAAQTKIAKEDPNTDLLDIDLGAPEQNYETWSYSPGNIHLSSKAFVELTRILFDDYLNGATVASFPRYTGGGR